MTPSLFYQLKDIVSVRVEHGHIPVSSSKIVYRITLAVEEGSLGRHDWKLGQE